MTETYTRGTKIVRGTTATLVAGDVVLTEPGRGHRDQRLARTKIGAELRTVQRVTPFSSPAYRTRRYAVVFTDGSATNPDGYAGHQTWPVVADPTV